MDSLITSLLPTLAAPEDAATLRALKRGLALAAARNTLYGFVLHTCPGYLMGWVHEEICRELDAFLLAVREKQSPRLMITMPPRHGKSELATRRFPAYAFGRCPDLSIISTSYGADLSGRMGLDVQRIMEDEAYGELFPATRLPSARTRAHGRNKAAGRPSAKGASDCPRDKPEPSSASGGGPGGEAGGGRRRTSGLFEIAGRSGSYRSAGIGGGITGMGGDILIIDDPFKDRAAADSPAMRQKVWDWYTSTLYTRLAPGGGILLIQTRWHMDDLAGRLLESARRGRGDAWRCIDFPAIAVTDEPHRKKGRALHPERYNTDRLAAIKAALGYRDWEALYQQRPVPDSGAVFKREWLRYWLPGDLPGRFDALLLSWDMAFKDSAEADFVVGQVWGRHGANLYLLDQVRGRMGFTATVQAFRELSAKWPDALEKLVEDKANGPAVIDSLKNTVPGIIPTQPDGSKTARAHAVTPLFEAGNVFLPHPQQCDWCDDYLSELLQFPAAAHDDQVDATTQALRRLSSRPPLCINPSILKPGAGA